MKTNSFLKKLLNPFLKIIYIPFHFLFSIIPKSEKIWVFGSWYGRIYNDNPRYFFEYLNTLPSKEVQYIWISRSSGIRNDLRKKGFKSFHPLSIKGIYFCSRAKFAIFSQSNNSDISWVTNNGSTKLIQLWHGIPLKKVGSDDVMLSIRKKRKKNAFLKLLKEKLFPFKKEVYDLMIACSDFDKNIFQSAFRVKEVVKTGYPRNDSLFLKSQHEQLVYKKIVYMPTFRGTAGDEFNLFDKYGFVAHEIDKSLSKMNCKLFIKTHPVNKPSSTILKQLDECKYIEIVDQYVDAFDVIKDADMLITDYSSVFFDYLLTKKPIIFSAFDFKNYISNNREIYCDYEAVTPGPKCASWGEVVDWIKIFINSDEPYADERTRMCNKFHENVQGSFSENLKRKLLSIK